LIQKAQSNINNNIDNADKKISSIIPVIPYSSIVENIMSKLKHITDEQLQSLVCEAFKYFDTLPDVFEVEDYNNIQINGYYLQRQYIVFQESFESNIKRLMKETGPYDPNIIKMLTNYAYCCKWLDYDPIEIADADEFKLFESFEIEITYKPDYNYSPGSSGSPETDEFDITKYNSKTVISALDNNWESKSIIIDNIFEKFFDEESFRSMVSNEDYF
jgi:hypothetical protein